MAAQEPEGRLNSDYLPDQWNEPAKLTYEWWQRERLRQLSEELRLQEELDRSWLEKQQLLDGIDGDDELLQSSAELQRIDAYRERLKELEARSAEGVTRANRALEQLEDMGKANLNEGRKLMYDWFKHLTTLGTGTILILGALSNNLLEDAVLTCLIPVVFVLLFFSLVTALYYMHSVSDIFLSSATPGRPQQFQNKTPAQLSPTLGYLWLVTLLLFGTGLFLFLIFAAYNLVR